MIDDVSNMKCTRSERNENGRMNEICSIPQCIMSRWTPWNFEKALRKPHSNISYHWYATLVITQCLRNMRRTTELDPVFHEIRLSNLDVRLGSSVHTRRPEFFAEDSNFLLHGRWRDGDRRRNGRNALTSRWISTDYRDRKTSDFMTIIAVADVISNGQPRPTY